MSIVAGIHAIAFHDNTFDFCLLHEIDGNSMYIPSEVKLASCDIVDTMLTLTGAVCVLESQFGYHFISPTLLNYYTWKRYQKILHDIYPVKYFGNVIRITRKPNEHRMKRFTLYTERPLEKHKISSIHYNNIELFAREVNLVLDTVYKIIPTTTWYSRYKAWNK